LLDCALLEGVLASFPQLAHAIDVERIAWPRPRREVVELIGAENPVASGSRARR
jgi:Protein of unknown function (DUF3088)